MPALLDLYRVQARMAVQQQLQYRMRNAMVLVGFLTEPVVYLAVWTAVAKENGGSVGGWTSGTLAAYFIVWTLVRSMNVVFTPYGFEWRIRTGQMSASLLRPRHPVHYDLAYFAGSKVVWFVMWLPIAAALALLFRPTLRPEAVEVLVFVVAIVGAYLIRSLLQWLIGMVTFWTTRVGALFEIYMVAELMLSGRLVPMSLMPSWVRDVAGWLPFKWTFGFPIEVLVGDLGTRALLLGLATQAAWIAATAGLLALAWRGAVRRYSAVGN
ncbi:ABC transporter permease [Virgisporangium aliadipatigenens]|nr:ABC-2 family transporter protein [Virgisporangium aliadipatigenens]